MAFSQSVLEHWTCFLESRATFLGFFEQTKTSMKQTNNAIKFLMAQYRAIFKNAYFKGLTTALVLTAGLAAASTAEAASSGTNFATDKASGSSINLVINSEGVFVNGSDTASSKNSVTGSANIEFTTSGGSALYGNTVVINDDGILQSETGNEGKDNLYIKGSITVNDGGKISLTGSASSGGGIQGWDGTASGGSATSGALTVNAGGTVSVTQSQIQMGDITITGEGATVTVGTNMGYDETNFQYIGATSGAATMVNGGTSGTASTWQDNAGIYGGNTLLLSNGAVSNGAVAHVNAGGQLQSHKLTVSNATINLAGTGGLDTTNSAFLLASNYGSPTDGASISLNNATVNVAGEDEDVEYTGHILIAPTDTKGASISTTNSTFNVDAGNNLLIGVAPQPNGTALDISTKSGGATVALNTGTVINNDGTVKLTAVSNVKRNALTPP